MSIYEQFSDCNPCQKRSRNKVHHHQHVCVFQETSMIEIEKTFRIFHLAQMHGLAHFKMLLRMLQNSPLFWRLVAFLPYGKRSDTDNPLNHWILVASVCSAACIQLQTELHSILRQNQRLVVEQIEAHQREVLRTVYQGTTPLLRPRTVLIFRKWFLENF